MRVSFLIPIVVAAVAQADLLDFDFGPTIFAVINRDLTAKNNYGAPIPPWLNGEAGWYYGPHPDDHHGIPCLNSDICNWLYRFPGALHCPPKYPPKPPPQHSTTVKPTSTKPTPTTTAAPTPTPTDGYTQTFNNITAAVQADDFMTFGLVETVGDCLEMCDNVDGCHFANTYHDVNGKGGSPLLTCSLFSGCHDAQDADNAGGQTQPDGSVDFIIDSDGWCKA